MLKGVSRVSLCGVLLETHLNISHSGEKERKKQKQASRLRSGHRRIQLIELTEPCLGCMEGAWGALGGKLE